MSRQRLIHDTSWAAACHVVERIQHMLREEELPVAHEEFFTIIKAAIETLDLMQAREDTRLIRQVGKN